MKPIRYHAKVNKEGQYLEVFLWEEIKEIQEYVRKRFVRLHVAQGMSYKEANERIDNGANCYLSTDWKYKSPDNPRAGLKNKKLGELHFISKVFVSPLIIHEIQHFIGHYAGVCEWDIAGKDNELIATTAETIFVIVVLEARERGVFLNTVWRDGK